MSLDIEVETVRGKERAVGQALQGPWHDDIFKHGLEDHGEVIPGVVSATLNQFSSFFLQEETETGDGMVGNTQ